MQQDYSFGVVPVYRNEHGEYEFLLIQQISYRGGTHRFWTFPKGHPETDETPEQAALRELEEETGITDITLDSESRFTIEYTFSHEGILCHKHVTYYLGYCAHKDTILTQPQEIQEMRWCTYDDAIELLSHDAAKEVLRNVQAVLAREEAT